MGKNFKCSKCGSNKFSMMTEVVIFSDVSYDNEGNTIYVEDDDRQYEKFSCYICSNCTNYLTNNGVIVCDEVRLKKYLEKYGVEKHSVSGEI